MRPIMKQAILTGGITLLAGCAGTGDALMAPDASSASRSASRCQNLTVEGTAALGPVELAPGVFTLGALPFPVTIAGVSGMLGSAVTGLEVSGAKGQGAQHITLVHSFVSPQGTFNTSDRAVCAVAGKDAGTCRVNDVLSVVSGTGVFANAGGSMRNHGVIDLNTYSLTVSLRGRICGDGV